MGLLFDEFETGKVYKHAGRIHVTQEDNVAFCGLTQNDQPLHLDVEAAKRAGFDDVLVNGLYTFSASVGLSVDDLTAGTLIANLGYDEVRHPRPVYPGDELHVVSTIGDKRISSKGKGIVVIHHEVRNQRGDVVCSYFRTAMVRQSHED